MKRFNFFVILFLFISINAYAASFVQPNPVFKVADSWLKILDQQRFDVAAQLTSEFFSVKNDQKVEENYLFAMRRPFGKVINRQLVSSETVDKLPGLGRGQHKVLLFKTVFKKKALGYETVNLKLSKNGQWYVTGYYIR